ncbi:MAG TPA: hypothetical protein VGI44_09115 [Acidimicrobiales bacterium]|jgi:hypothetical protein
MPGLDLYDVSGQVVVVTGAGAGAGSGIRDHATALLLASHAQARPGGHALVIGWNSSGPGGTMVVRMFRPTTRF